MEHAKKAGAAADITVSRAELLKFIEAKFQMADRDHDGRLNITELGNFLRFVSHPELRALKSWERYGETRQSGQGPIR